MARWIGRASLWGLSLSLLWTGACTSANPNYLAGDGSVAHDGRVSRDGLLSEAGPKDLGLLDGLRCDKGIDAPTYDGPRRDLPSREDGHPKDSLAPDSLAPDSLAPDSLAPDSLAPDSLAPDSLAPDSLAPDTFAPDSLAPDTFAPDSLAPDLGQPECWHDWQCNDSKSCTKDSCASGHCTNTLVAGYCLIGGICRAEGWTRAGDVCNECVTAVSTKALTFVAGKACGSLGMCLQGGCHEWKTRPDIEPALGTGNHVLATTLESVDAVPGGKDIWAVGRYEDAAGHDGGLLSRLDSSTTPALPVAVLTSKGLADLSYGLAVGDGGIAYHYDKGKWKAQAAIETALNGVDRLGVWGRRGASQSEVFYLAGRHSQTGIPGVLRCSVRGNGASCAKEYGFRSGEVLGPIFGVVAGKQQRLWTLRQGSIYNDIYSRGTSSSFWSTAPPAGCLDSAQGSGNQACSNTPGEFRAVYAASLSEAWIVGDGGLVLRYQGATGWKRMPAPAGVSTASYNLTAVYASVVEGIVSVVGYADFGGFLRRVGMFNYNLKLGRWLGPIVIRDLVVTGSGSNDPGRIRHLGGSGYDNLWMVGDRWKSSLLGSSRRVGWVLALE